MLEAYYKSRLCLSCDSTAHPMPKCPNGTFVCPNCHASEHRGTECPRICRYCGLGHSGTSITACIKKHARKDPSRKMLIVSQDGQSSSDTEQPEYGCRPDNWFGRTVWVSRIPHDATDGDLTEAIEPILTDGKVLHICRRDGSNWAYVEMSSLEAAYELVSKQTQMMGKSLKVQFRKSLTLDVAWQRGEENERLDTYL
eukprot:GHVO01004100.1.p1 GENE.GHVO01004100.1~~GHVO01004100.1.p1  ORF type:complete len:198 (+),score=23.19 GHVO01004100.1:204-797(+)